MINFNIATWQNNYFSYPKDFKQLDKNNYVLETTQRMDNRTEIEISQPLIDEDIRITGITITDEKQKKYADLDLFSMAIAKKYNNKHKELNIEDIIAKKIEFNDMDFKNSKSIAIQVIISDKTLTFIKQIVILVENNILY